MKKKKILIVSCVHPPYVSENNGVANVIKTTYELLGGKFEFSAFALGLNDKKKIKFEDLEHNGIKIRFLHNVTNSQSDFFYRFKKEDYCNKEVEKHFSAFLKTVNPDVVHFHSINGLGANLINAAKRYKKKAIVTLHDFWWICPSIFLIDLYEKPIIVEKEKYYDSQNYIKQINKIFPEKNIAPDFGKKRKEYLYKNLQRADAVIANSSFVQRIYRKLFGKINFITVNNPVYLPKNLPESKKVDQDKIIIGFLGGRSTFKGCDTLINAYKSIANQNSELHIYGSPLEQERFLQKLLGKIKNPANLKLSLVKYLNSKSNIKRNAKIFDKGVYTKEDKYETINTADIVVIPSKARESFSLATFEPMILNKFIIVSDSGNQKDLLRGYPNYLIFKTGDEEDLTKKLKIAIKRISSRKSNANNNFAKKMAVRFNKDFEREIVKIYSD